MEEIKDDPLNCVSTPVGKQGVIPWCFKPFLKSKLTSQDRRFILGKPLIINFKNSGDTIKTYIYVHNYNFFIGSSWGLLSGVASGSFFKADEISSRLMLLLKETDSNNRKSGLSLASSVARAGVFSWRIASRCSLCFICFELMERNIREGWNFITDNGQSKKNRDCGHLLSLPVTMALTTLLFPIDKCMKMSSIFGLCLSAGLSLGLNCGHILLRKRDVMKFKGNSRYS